MCIVCSAYVSFGVPYRSQTKCNSSGVAFVALTRSLCSGVPSAFRFTRGICVSGASAASKSDDLARRLAFWVSPRSCKGVSLRFCFVESTSTLQMPMVTGNGTAENGPVTTSQSSCFSPERWLGQCCFTGSSAGLVFTVHTCVALNHGLSGATIVAAFVDICLVRLFICLSDHAYLLEETVGTS